MVCFKSCRTSGGKEVKTCGRNIYHANYFRCGKCYESFYLQMAGRKRKTAAAWTEQLTVTSEKTPEVALRGFRFAYGILIMLLVIITGYSQTFV